ncbi:hypothetical protein ACWGEU_08085 [Streptomyces goshikiensis]
MRNPLLLAFQAFEDQRRRHYLTYARSLLTADEADNAVRSTFTALAIEWTTVVTSPDPAVRAWDQFITQIYTLTPGGPPPPDNGITALADLGFTPQTCADITGRDIAQVHALLHPSARPKRHNRSSTPHHPAGPTTEEERY